MDEITRYVDFVTAVQEVMSNCELREKEPVNDPTVWQASLTMGQDKYFVLKKSASHYYFRGLDYVRDELAKGNVTISEGYTASSYTKFIEDQVRNGGNPSNDCQTFIDGLKALQLKQFKFLIPISHYDYRGDIDLGKVRVVRLTDQLLKDEFDVEGDITQVVNTNKLTEFNDTNIYAIVKVESVEKTHAEELAFRLVERFIYATKLIDPGSFVRLRKWAMNQVNENVLVKQGKGFNDSMHSHHLLVRITPSPQFYTNLQPYWNKLSKFLYSDTPNNLQEVILSALYWYGEADVHTDSRVKLYSNLVTGLEWIVLHIYGRTFAKADNFGKNCAIIFSGDEQYWEFWRKYYWKRNDLSHQKLVEIYKEEIDTLRLNLRSLLLQLIDFTDNYTIVSDVFDNEFGIQQEI